MKPGLKSSEFIGFATVVLMAAAKLFGVIPQDATGESVSGQFQDALPLIINNITDLVKGNSSILIPAGLAWAYMRRRSGLKARELDKTK